MTELTIRDVMTESAHAIEREATLADAHQLMRAHGVRHLPVLEQGRLVGLVSMDDLHLLETLQDVDPGLVTVAEALTPDPYVVAPATPLRTVAAEMAERRIGSAVVAEEGRVLGMFTTVDALRVLGSLLGAGPLAT